MNVIDPDANPTKATIIFAVAYPLLFRFSLVGDNDLNRFPMLEKVRQNLFDSLCTIGSCHTTSRRRATLTSFTII
jgi:hypothetical protein